YYWLFCFRAEDGIRDDLVTGVQTCALPIYPGGDRGLSQHPAGDAPGPWPEPRCLPGRDQPRIQLGDDGRLAAGRRQDDRQLRLRSEERRVGEEWKRREGATTGGR